MPTPDPNDNILDNVIGVDVPVPVSEPKKEPIMADVPPLMHEQNLSRIAQAGATAGENAVTFNTILHLSYEADRKMVSMVEALGVREVTSQSGQLGIPNAAQQGSAGVNVPGSK